MMAIEFGEFVGGREGRVGREWLGGARCASLS